MSALAVVLSVALVALVLLVAFILWITAPKDTSYCPKREDKIHCSCWWDGKACCSCGAPAVMEDFNCEQ